MTRQADTVQSAWQAAGFPFGFRFRNPMEIFRTICSAMAERSCADSRINCHIDTEDNRIDAGALKNMPKNLRDKNYWHFGSEGESRNLWYFLQRRIYQIASCFCDPEKADDFEHYPDLENWTYESLEDKLKDDCVRFSAFCDREKFLLFVWKVLNLCCVRRVGVVNDNSCGYVREHLGIPSYDNIPEALEELKNIPYRNGQNRGQLFVTKCNGIGDYSLLQSSGRFVTWVDDTRPCDIKFYCLPQDGYDEYSNFGIGGIKPGRWHCAGKPDIFETTGRVKTAAVEFPFPDSEIPAVPELQKNKSHSVGFTLQEFKVAGETCCGYAVRDYRNYLKYFER